MNQYFFGLTKAEKQNILDQHKSLYDGYVTLYDQTSNTTPLYVQDYANDKGGITVSNKGNVTNYKNVGINEDINRKDRIGDGPDDLENGTVDLKGSVKDGDNEYMHDLYPSPNEDEVDYVSLGSQDDDSNDGFQSFVSGLIGDEEDDMDGELDIVITDENPIEDSRYEYDIDELENFLSGPMNEIDEDLQENFINQISESLDMFKRFKKYN